MMGKKEQVPDVVGLTQEEGCLILQRGGYHVDLKYTYFQNKSFTRIVRQRVLKKGTVELVISDEYYNDPTIKEKEVNKSGI